VGAGRERAFTGAGTGRRPASAGLVVTALVLAALALSAAGCGSRERPPQGVADAASTGAGLVRLVISLPGDDLAGAAELALRERIRSRLDERGIGAFAGASTGMGFMAVSFRVADAGRARRAMEVVMAAEAPGMRYQVRTGD
jgi:hypothetical protein